LTCFFIGSKDDYDLCSACFSHMGKDSEYTRLDKPTSVNVRVIGFFLHDYMLEEEINRIQTYVHITICRTEISLDVFNKGN
jgi:hypothetical protein